MLGDAMNIPSSSTSQHNHPQPLHEPYDKRIVGSQDSIAYRPLTRHSPATTDFVDALPRSRRPVQNRSVSSPFLIHRNANVGRHASAQAGSSNDRPRPQPIERQWTLFGQMMENEGQLPSPDSLISQRPAAADPVDGQQATFVRSSRNQENEDPLVDVQLRSDLNVTPTSQEVGNLALGRNDADSVHSFSASSLSDHTETPSSFSYRQPAIPLLYRNILKCAIAYFVASLFTFSPYLSTFIGDLTSYGKGGGKPSPSGHMVATIAVYFNPAKTMGAMLEADLFCLFGLFYSSFVCLASMSMFWWLELQPGWEWLGDLVAISWIALSISAIAWMKSWMASPSFNTGNMTVIIIFIVLVKEGGLQTLLHVLAIVFFGSLISNIVCFIIWPQSATYNLETNMVQTLESFSTLLDILTDVFLLENDHGQHYKNREKIQKAVQDHQDSFTSLKKNLSEAKSEWILRGGKSISIPTGSGADVSDRNSVHINGISGAAAYEDTVDSLNRLAQHLNGLRSGTGLQHELTKAGIAGKRRPGASKDKAGNLNQPRLEDDEDAMLKAAAEMFGDLVDDLGPPLNALSDACTYTLQKLRGAFFILGSKPKPPNLEPVDFAELVGVIERALLRFESTSNHAVLRFYKKSDFNGQSRPISIASLYHVSENETKTVVGAENENIFLVYFFIFTLEEFSRELLSLIYAVQRIYTYEELRKSETSWSTFPKRWLTKARIGFSQWFTSDTTQSMRKDLKKRFSTYLVPYHRIPHPSFPKIRPHAPNTIQTPDRKKLSFTGRLKHSLWVVGIRLGERDVKYAIKAGVATALLASPAFFDYTRPLFTEYFGDWALISFFVVISPTIGATNYLSLQRVLGTLFGASVAAGMYTLFPEQASVLAPFGFLFSIPCFYFAVAKPQYLSASRFVLLTYNLTCLYCYNLRENDIYVWDVAFHRAFAVIVGVLWAAMVSRFWWPAEARRELSKALGEFCLNIGWLYTRLVAFNSYSSEHRQEIRRENQLSEGATTSNEVHSTNLNNSIQEFMAMELHLQIKLIELQGLLAQAQHEPRLKGPFPVQLYRGILTSLQTILDRLHSMRCVTTREEWQNSVRNDFIVPVNKERREMVGNIILSFSTLASAFRLKAPLPPYLPPAEQSRQRLVDAIRRLDIVKRRDVKGSRQLLFFAYALTMKGVTQELESLGRTLQNAFGVIGQSAEEFEALFVDLENGNRYMDNSP